MLPDRATLPERSIALVIDDQPDSLGVVSSALEDAGMTVLVARSGADGIDLARRVQPDVVLMDAVMPGMDGFEACRILKTPPNPDPTPVIFMTGLTEPEHIVEGLRSGGVDYVAKPVVVDELIARVITHILNAHAIKSARSALDSAGQWVLAFTRDGLLSWGSTKALALLERPESREIVENRHAAPDFAQWLRALPGQPISEALPFDGRCVTAKYIGLAQNEILVSIKWRSELGGADGLSRAFGLTRREAEVLLWLTRGKTNRDIADILSLSARTVNKHLEQVFLKMGVDNRTSAAVIADRVLQSTDP